MTKPDLPVEAQLLAALKREMQRRPDEAVEKAVAARLGATLGPSFGAPDLQGVNAATGVVGGVKGAASAAATGLSWGHPLVVLVASATISTGALLGVETLREPAVRPAAPLVSRAPAAPPVPRAAVPPVLEQVAPASESAPPSAVPRAPAPKAGVGMSVSSSTEAPEPSLREQQALLDTARRALAKRDGAAALEALVRHRSRFPRTALAEEREALTVKALRESGRAAEATERARRFSEQYPRSVFSPGVSSGPDAIP